MGPKLAHSNTCILENETLRAAINYWIRVLGEEDN